MEEMDNQIQEIEYILPDDYEETEETPEVETEETEETNDEVVEEVTEAAETFDLGELEVKFLKESKKLKDIPKEEIGTLIQKGMNHDRLIEKHKKEMTESLEGFEEIAGFYGFDLATLKDALQEQWFAYKAEQEGKSANEIKLEYKLNKGQKTPVDKQAQAFEKLLDKHNVTPDDIKPETWELFKEGTDLSTAYEIQLKDEALAESKAQIAKLQAEVKVAKQNQAVKQKGVVKPTTSNGSDDIEDDFLAGLFGR
jgi:hypothetical protein